MPNVSILLNRIRNVIMELQSIERELASGRDTYSPPESGSSKFQPRKSKPGKARYERPKDFGKHFGVTAKTVRKWARKQLIRSFKPNKSTIFIPVEEYERFGKRLMRKAVGDE